MQSTHTLLSCLKKVPTYIVGYLLQKDKPLQLDGFAL